MVQKCRSTRVRLRRGRDLLLELRSCGLIRYPQGAFLFTIDGLTKSQASE